LYAEVCTLLLFVVKPKFLCNHEMYVKINEPYYILECKVHANPDVQEAQVTFIDPELGNHTVNILDGAAEYGDYHANVSVGVSITKLLH